jgi:hypothetical protein
MKYLTSVLTESFPSSTPSPSAVSGEGGGEGGMEESICKFAARICKNLICKSEMNWQTMFKVALSFELL